MQQTYLVQHQELVLTPVLTNCMVIILAFSVRHILQDQTPEQKFSFRLEPHPFILYGTFLTVRLAPQRIYPMVYGNQLCQQSCFNLSFAFVVYKREDNRLHSHEQRAATSATRW